MDINIHIPNFLVDWPFYLGLVLGIGFMIFGLVYKYKI